MGVSFDPNGEPEPGQCSSPTGWGGANFNAGAAFGPAEISWSGSTGGSYSGNGYSSFQNGGSVATMGNGGWGFSVGFSGSVFAGGSL